MTGIGIGTEEFIGENIPQIVSETISNIEKYIALEDYKDHKSASERNKISDKIDNNLERIFGATFERNPLGAGDLTNKRLCALPNRY